MGKQPALHDHLNTSQRGLYYNPVKTSQENLVRLSQTLKDKDDSKNLLKEKTINLAEISKHSYLRKSKSKLNDT